MFTFNELLFKVHFTQCVVQTNLIKKDTEFHDKKKQSATSAASQVCLPPLLQPLIMCLGQHNQSESSMFYLLFVPSSAARSSIASQNRLQ